MGRLALLGLLLLGAVCVSTAQDNDTDAVVVFCSRDDIMAVVGSSITLKCEAQYKVDLCGTLHVVWSQQSEELSEPSRYLTTVSEKMETEDIRRRYVSTEILRLTPGDRGSYQCSAQCQNGDTALGHFININIKG